MTAGGAQGTVSDLAVMSNGWLSAGGWARGQTCMNEDLPSPPSDVPPPLGLDDGGCYFLRGQFVDGGVFGPIWLDLLRQQLVLSGIVSMLVSMILLVMPLAPRRTLAHFTLKTSEIRLVSRKVSREVCYTIARLLAAPRWPVRRRTPRLLLTARKIGYGLQSWSHAPTKAAPPRLQVSSYTSQPLPAVMWAW